jgi:hypothetical protein
VASGRDRCLIERVDLLAAVGRECDMDRPDRRVCDRDREVVGFLQAERDLLSAFAPRSDLGEPERVSARR